MGEDQRESKARNNKKIAIIGKLIAVILVAFLGGWLGSRAYLSNRENLRPQTEVARKTVTSQSELISSIAKDVGKSVVSINVTSSTRTVDPLFGDSSVQQQRSAGTGFLISKNGYIVTNRHVVSSASSTVEVVMSDGTVFDNVEVVGKTASDDSLDIAFLKIKDSKGKKLEPVNIGDSSQMKVGDMVVAIGNALGEFQNTVTSGIISGYGRSVQARGESGGVETLQNLFQTDAAINQGNSGGPLVNADGQVIGINTAVAGEAENIGFAIPINDVNGLIESVLDQGKLLRPYLGVRYIQLNREVAKELDLKEDQQGAYILSSGGSAAIIKDSPADKAGLEEKDIITKINNIDVTQNSPLSSVIGRFKVGEEVMVTYLRDNNKKQTKVTLEALNE